MCSMRTTAASRPNTAAWCRGWLFAINRKRFLKGLLARDRIYVSDHFHERLDAQARSNLRRAITTKR
jgi:predicted metal-dependent HD superfamily phosphohydrolase